MVKNILSFCAIFAMVSLCMSYSYGPASGGAGDRTGSPINSGATCSSSSGCHTSLGSFTPSTTVQLLSGTTPVSSYTASTAYTVRITVSSSTSVTSNTRYSFQIVCVQSSSNNAVNAWGTPPSGTHSTTLSGRNYIEHSTQLTSGVIDIPWTAPATSTGNITFYCTGNVVNNNFSETGDNCVSTSLTIVPSSGGCSPPTLSTTVSNILCKGDSTGAITLGTTGGSSPFVYAWTGPSGYNAATQNITGLKAGTYNVTVTATGGCTATTSATVTEPATKITTSTSSNTPLCVGNTLNLSSTTSGGTGAYTYLWSGPLSYSNTNSAAVLTSVTAAMAGKYIFTVRDANGCTAKDTENVVINIKPNADSINANAASSQSYNFLAINAIGNPKYSWNFGDGNTDTTVAPSHTFNTTGSYTVRLILSNSCGSDTLFKTLFIAKTDIESFSNLSSAIQIAPNPAHSYTQITCVHNIKSERITVYNLYGMKISDTYSDNSGIYILNTAAWAKGLYLIYVETNKGNVVKQLSVE